MRRTSDRIKETIEVVEGLVVVDRHCRLMMGRHRRAWVFYTPQILLELSVVGDDFTEIQLANFPRRRLLGNSIRDAQAYIRNQRHLAGM